MEFSTKDLLVFELGKKTFCCFVGRALALEQAANFSWFVGFFFPETVSAS